MFTWICPQCGREVPPSYTECPDCAARQKAPPAPVAEPSMPAPFREPPVPSPPPAPVYQRARSGPPTWLMSVLFALVFVGLGAGAYFAVQRLKGDTGPAPARLEPVPVAPPAASARPNPLLKHIEIVGLRLTQDAKKKTQVRFILVNHSGAELSDLAGSVDLRARTNKKDEETVGTFTFRVPSLGPYESKELSSALNTQLHVYELPDWQNLREEIRITSP